MRKKLAFIGVGNMASAILAGITSRNAEPIDWSDIILFDRQKDKNEKYIELGATSADSIEEAVRLADCVLLCVKPQNFCEVLPLISTVQGVEKKLFITIAAGISSDTVTKATNNAAVVRVMPNTPMLIGKGVSALSRNAYVSDCDFEFACNIFASAGSVIAISEDEMNRIICVTGSSPAYVFMMIKAMYDGAVSQSLLKTEQNSGLTEKELTNAICDTIIGAATLLKTSDKSPEELIAAVCSKGGTTERAVAELERYKFYEAFTSAMQKCTDRADELGSLNK